MNAKQILRLEEPEHIFSNNLDEAKREFYNVSKQWHPDLNKSPEATDVFAHLKYLYDKVTERIKNGQWESPDTLAFTVGANTIEYPYIKAYVFELGKFYTSDEAVTYVLKPKFKDLYRNAKERITRLKFSSNRMEKEMKRFLPEILDSFICDDGRCVMRVRKNKDLILLREVMDYYKNNIDPRHIAWVQNSLHNISCYLDYTKVVHCDISPDTYFVSPKKHGGVLLGGWWYAKPKNDYLEIVPSRTHKILPLSIKNDKMAITKIDLELIKAIGRESLGDIGGTKLLTSKAPKDMVNYLRGMTNDKPVEEYKKWMKVLESSFGARHFIKMEITPSIVN